MEIYKKLQACRQSINVTKMQKLGYNNYSDYYYFLPEQVNKLVQDACFVEKLFYKYDMKKNEFGIYATLTIINIDDPKEIVVFTIITDIPTMTASNIAQQLGGAITYSERYLKMSTFGIMDNTLDFDADPPPRKPVNKKDKIPQKSNKKEPENWLNKYANKDKTKIDSNYWKIINEAKKKNMTIADLRKYYKISKEVAKEMETDML